MVVLEKTIEGLLDCKEIKPVNPKGSEPWICIRRTDAELMLQYFGHLIQKDSDAGKEWRLKQKWAAEDEMCHLRLCCNVI